MKLLILCNDFPPLNSIGAQRPYSWYLHLKEFGIEPVVVTKNWKGYSSTPIDVLRNVGERTTTIEETEHGTLIRVPFEVTPSERMLLKHGEYKRRLKRKAYTFTFRIGSFLSTAFDPHRNILFEADKYLATHRVDGIIASGEPFILFRYCYLLSRKHRLPWIADYRDGWSLNYVRRQMDFLNRFLLRYEYRFEKKYIHTAKCITTIDPLLAKALSELHAKPVEVVFNGFDGYYQPDEILTTASTPLTINHTGTLTPGQRVEILLQAVDELLNENRITSDELVMRFIGLEYFPEQHKRITQFSSRVAQCIESSPRIPRADVLRLNSGADFLITFTEEKFKLINAKTYDYLAVKRPILIVPGDESLLSDLVRDLQAGESLNNVQEIKEFLLKAIDRKRKGMRIEPYPLKENEALFYTRREQTKRLSHVIRKYFTGT